MQNDGRSHRPQVALHKCHWTGRRGAGKGRAVLSSFMHLTYFHPLWWLLGLLVLAMGYFFTLVDRPQKLMAASLVLRGLAVVFLVLALCRPGWMRQVDDVHVVFLVDVSQSVDLAAARAVVDEVNAAVAKLE